MKQEDFFDDYLAGELPSEDRREFEDRLRTDLQFASAFKAHQEFIDVLRRQALRKAVAARVSEVHNRVFGTKALPAFSYWRTVAVAAGTAVVAVMSTVMI